MKIQYDDNKLNAVLSDFFLATKINVDFLDSDMKVIYKKGRKTPNPYCRAIRSTRDGRSGCAGSDRKLLQACRESRQVEISECHAGLIDAAAPIILGRDIVGYLIIGPMRQTKSFSEIEACIAGYPVHGEKMEKYYGTLPMYDRITISSIANIAAMLAKYVIQESMLRPTDSLWFETVRGYIDDHITTISGYKDIADHLHISRSTLFRDFRKYCGVAPQSFIIERKIEYAKKLLIEEDCSIESVSRRLGFCTLPYFGRTFKKYVGATPSAYRKRHR